MKINLRDYLIMKIDSSNEVKLSARKSVELLRILKNRLPRIQSVHQSESVDTIQLFLKDAFLSEAFCYLRYTSHRQMDAF